MQHLLSCGKMHLVGSFSLPFASKYISNTKLFGCFTLYVLLGHKSVSLISGFVYLLLIGFSGISTVSV